MKTMTTTRYSSKSKKGKMRNQPIKVLLDENKSREWLIKNGHTQFYKFYVESLFYKVYFEPVNLGKINFKLTNETTIFESKLTLDIIQTDNLDKKDLKLLRDFISKNKTIKITLIPYKAKVYDSYNYSNVNKLLIYEVEGYYVSGVRGLLWLLDLKIL